MDFTGMRVWGVGSLGVGMEGFYTAAVYVASQSACGLRVLFCGAQRTLIITRESPESLSGRATIPYNPNGLCRGLFLEPLKSRDCRVL